MHKLYITFFFLNPLMLVCCIGPQYPFGIYELFSRRIKKWQRLFGIRDCC